MCNIVMLGEGVSIPFNKFENMVHNNPHGFGLILKDKKNKKLQVIRRCHEKGNDPKEIYELLEDNKDIERYLHVRWRTDGPIDIDNTHPFPAYISDNRQIYFMHNGVLNDFKPTSGRITWVDNKRIEEPSENISDSKKFNDEFLAPYLLTSSGQNGKADISDPVFQKIIHKFWGNSDSRGLLICNDLEPVQINSSKWHELDFGSGKFWSSNNTYFDNLIRGPVYEEKKKKREEEEAKQRQGRFQGSASAHNRSNKGVITDLKELDLKAREIKTEELSDIFEDYNIWEEEGMAALNNLTAIQLEELVKKTPDQAVNLLLTLTGYYSGLYEKYSKLVRWVESTGKTKPKEL